MYTSTRKTACTANIQVPKHARFAPLWDDFFAALVSDRASSEAVAIAGEAAAQGIPAYALEFQHVLLGNYTPDAIKDFCGAREKQADSVLFNNVTITTITIIVKKLS